MSKKHVGMAYSHTVNLANTKRLSGEQIVTAVAGAVPQTFQAIEGSVRDGDAPSAPCAE